MSLADKLRKEKERLDVEGEKRGGGDYAVVNWFKPEKGKNFIRFLANPVADKGGDPVLWVERTVHFGLPIKKKDGGVVKISTRCLRDLDKSCPMCDKYEELIEKGDKEAANELKPTVRYFYNVINYKSKKAEVMTAGSMIHKDVVESIDLGVDFWDVKEGLDFKLTKEVEPGKPARFGTKYSLRPAKLDKTALPPKLLEEAGNAIDLYTVYNEDNGERMVEAFGGKVETKKAVKAEKESVEEEYYKDDEEESAEEVKAEASTLDTGGDDELEAELKSLGL